MIVHCKRDKYDVYIGRPSKWGNPYIIGKDGTRQEVIEKYRDYILTRPNLLASLPELEGKILGCWCSPKPCHGEVLLELLKRGKAVNDLEMFLKCCEKALKDKLADNPKSGVKSGNSKMRYSKALDLLVVLRKQYALRGAFSLGICMDCSKFSDIRMTAKDGLGHCGSKVVSAFDSCEHHSKEGDDCGV
jgi:hypothetical protein